MGFCYGPSNTLVTDNGSEMTAKIFTYVCQILWIKSVFTITYHRHTNAQAECLNRTILASLRHYVADH